MSSRSSCGNLATQSAAPETGVVRRVSYSEQEIADVTKVVSSPKKRRVNFDGIQVYRVEKLSPEYEEELWYTDEELSEMKREVKRLCRRRELEEPLAAAYQWGTTTAKRPVDAQAEAQAVTKLLQSDFFHHQRGLERWSSSMHTMSRAMTAMQVKTEVLCAEPPDFFEIGDTDELLAEACAEASAPAVRFARLLGQIDAIEAKRMNEDV